MTIGKNRRVLALIVASTVCFAYCMVNYYLMQGGMNVLNIEVYFGAIAIYAVAYLLADSLFAKVDGRILARRNLRYVTMILVSVAGAYWFVRAYSEEIYDKGFYFPTRLVRHRGPVIVYVLALVMLTVILISIIARKKESLHSKIYRLALGGFFVFVDSMLLFTRNIFCRYSMETYHITAYTNSILNVQSLTPYDLSATSIYGHYGIVYFIPVLVLRLLGANKWIAVSLSITFFGFIAYMAQTLLMNYLLEDDLFFTMGVICSAVMHIERNDGIYYQINPHRILFPSIVLLLCYLLCEKRSKAKQYELLLWITSCIAIIWNLETGMVCTGVTLLCTVYCSCMDSGRYKLKLVLRSMTFMLCSVAFAYVIPNIYNVTFGGKWNSLLEYMYPSGSLLKNLGIFEKAESAIAVASLSDNLPIILSKSGTMQYDLRDILQTTFGTPFEGYWIFIILLSGFVMCNVKDVLLFRSGSKDITVFMTSIMGLGLFTYYINRATSSNLALIVFEFTIVVVYVLSRTTSEIPKNKSEVLEKALGFPVYVMGIVIVASLCISTVGAMHDRIEVYQTYYYDTSEQELYLWKLRDVLHDLPEGDEVAFVGFDAQTIAALLDVNSLIHIMDFEDMTEEGLARMQEVIEKEKFPYIMVFKLGEHQMEYIPSAYQMEHDFGDSQYLYKRYE